MGLASNRGFLVVPALYAPISPIEQFLGDTSAEEKVWEIICPILIKEDSVHVLK